MKAPNLDTDAQLYRDRIATLEEQLAHAQGHVDHLLAQVLQLEASRRAWASAAADLDAQLEAERSSVKQLLYTRDQLQRAVQQMGRIQ
jgi:chromosome segregation ATPase